MTATERSEAGVSPFLQTGRRLIRSSVAGTIAASIVGQLALAVSGICSARALGVENRGYLALLMLVPLILVQLGGMGVPSAVTYVVARGRGIESLPRRTVALVVVQGTAVLTVSAASFAVLVADNDPYVQTAAALTLPAAPAWLLMQYGVAILQGQGRFVAFNILRNVPALLYAVVTVALLALGIDSLGAFALLWSLTWPASALATGIVVRRFPGRPARTDGMRALIGFGLRALPGVSSPLETFRLDQALVGLLLSPYDLGLYVVAVVFTVMPRLLALSVGAVAYPRLAVLGRTTVARALARRAVWLTIWLCLGVLVPLFLFAPDIVSLVFGEQFSDATSAMRILLVGAFLAAVRRVISDVARGLGEPAVGSYGEVASWASAIPLLAVLLPAYGLEGVALALAAASAVGLLAVVGTVRWRNS